MHPFTSSNQKTEKQKDEIQYSQKAKLKPLNEILKLANGLLGSSNFNLLKLSKNELMHL
jgi:hypothetical protein